MGDASPEHEARSTTWPFTPGQLEATVEAVLASATTSEAIVRRTAELRGRLRAGGLQAADQIADHVLIAALERNERELLALTLSDHLTGLGNRRAFESDLPGDWARCEREETELALVAADLDGLKLINDRTGHAAGDEALRAWADAWRAHVRVYDGIYRLGGDELTAVLPATGRDEAAGIVERVQEAGPRFSAGIATSSEVSSINDLLNLADQRLYDAKRARVPRSQP